MWRVLSVLLLLGVLTSSVHGQVVTATLYGTVLDPNGASIPGAIVTVQNVNTGATLSSVTNNLGEFSFPALQPGEYSMRIEAQGFKTLQRTGLTFSAGQSARLSFPLELGAVSEVVEVTAEAPLVNAANAEQRVTLGTTRIEELPIVRRDWTNLLNLGTGVQTTGGTVRINGLAPSSFRLTVDGTDATQDTELPSFSMSGNFNYIKGVSTEAIAEVNLTKGIASAEIANTMSGNVNIITKSGTNDFHGSAFWLNNVEELNARQQFLSNKPNLVYNQFGGSLGGPILRDKLFFFGVYEGYRQRGFQSLNDQVPTPEFKQQIIAANPIYRNLFSVFPDPNQAYAPGARTGAWVGSGTEQADDNHAVARIDYHITGTNILSGRYTRGRPMRLVPRVVSANNRTWSGTVEQGNLNWTHARPTWTFQTRFGVNYNFSPRIDGIFNLYDEDVSYNGISGLGFGLSGEIIQREGHSWSIEESIAKTFGRHSIKFGGSFMNTQGSRFNTEIPVLTYSTVNDLIANIPNRGRVTMGVSEYQASFKSIGLFFQDDFKVTQRLVLNLGVRWDYFTVPSEQDGRLFNRAQPFGTGPYVDPDEIWRRDFNNFSPRVGFAYGLTESRKTVLRGGAGIFHNPRPLYGGPVDIVRDAVDEPFRVEYGRQDALQYEQFRWPVSNEVVRSLVKGSQALDGGTAINTDFPYPRSYQWNFGIQHEFPGAIALDTAYVGTRGVNLMMVRFWNQVDRITGERPYPGFTEFRYRDAGESTFYNAWQTSVRKRFGSGLQLGGNYTYAYGYAYTNDGDLLLPDSVQDIYNVRADKGPSNSDIRHTFTGDFLYELPFARALGNPSLLVRNLLGGWQIAGFFTAQSGQPINIEQESGLESSRPDYIGGDPTLSGSRDSLVYLNRSAFSPVPIGEISGVPIRPGNIGRNALRMPSWWNMDLSLSKRLFIGERVRTKFDAQMLNAFNHTVLSSLESRLTRNDFGRFRGTRGARVIQLGVRLEF